MRLNKDGRSYLVRWPNSKQAMSSLATHGRANVTAIEKAPTSSTTSTTTPSSSAVGTTSGTPSNIGTSTSYSSSLPAGVAEPESPINLGQSVYASRWVKCLHNFCSLLRFKCLRRNRHRKRAAAAAAAGGGHKHCHHRHRRRHRALSRQPRVHRHQHFRFPSSGANNAATTISNNDSVSGEAKRNCVNGNLVVSCSSNPNRIFKSVSNIAKQSDHLSVSTETKRNRRHRICQRMHHLIACKDCCTQEQTITKDNNNNTTQNNNHAGHNRDEIFEMKSLPSHSTLGTTAVSTCQSYNMLNIHNPPTPQQEPVMNDRKQVSNLCVYCLC